MAVKKRGNINGTVELLMLLKGFLDGGKQKKHTDFLPIPIPIHSSIHHDCELWARGGARGGGGGAEGGVDRLGPHGRGEGRFGPRCPGRGPAHTTKKTFRVKGIEYNRNIVMLELFNVLKISF